MPTVGPAGGSAPACDLAGGDPDVALARADDPRAVGAEQSHVRVVASKTSTEPVDSRIKNHGFS